MIRYWLFTPYCVTTIQNPTVRNFCDIESGLHRFSCVFFKYSTPMDYPWCQWAWRPSLKTDSFHIKIRRRFLTSGMFLFVNWEANFPIDINRVVSRHADSMRSTAAAAATDHRFRSEKISEASAAGVDRFDKFWIVGMSWIYPSNKSQIMFNQMTITTTIVICWSSFWLYRPNEERMCEPLQYCTGMHRNSSLERTTLLTQQAGWWTLLDQCL